MAPIKTSHFLKFFQNLDPVSRFVFLSLGLCSLSLLAIGTWGLVDRWTPPELILAAGDKEGESYIISEAIEKVVESKSNIKITLKETDSTSESLEMLRKNEIALAAVQADVAAEEMDTFSVNKVQSLPSEEKKADIRTIAILYQDLFQLVVKDPKILQFVQLRGKTVALPAKGGQYQSFLRMIEHYSLFKKDRQTLDVTVTGVQKSNYDDKQAEEDFKSGKADALFRVRAPGNHGIATLVKDFSGQLVAIQQAEAMKIKHPALENGTIPLGAYRGNPPVPSEDLPTVAVSRILVASDKVDKNIIKEITRIIIENRQDIANAISPEHPEVKSLVANIDDPRKANTAGLPPLHPGALAFYERDRPSFIQENADYLGLLLTVILLTFYWIRQLKIWMESRRKNEADDYIQSAINLMKTIPGNLDTSQKRLDEIFRKAADALIDERISQESFRTFNEAYKTTREAIDRERLQAQEQIQRKQREVSATYIKTMVELLHDRRKKDILQQKLDKVLNEVAEKLIAEEISQESFRTFIEAYRTTREAIERNYEL